MAHVTIEQGNDGRAVMVEPVTHAGLVQRVFRYMACGALEYATMSEWRAHGPRARFYGYISRELPPSMSCIGGAE
jgi:hypothetical protein